VPPNTWDILTAISGEDAAFSVYEFRKRVARHPKAAAASVIVKLNGSMH